MAKRKKQSKATQEYNKQLRRIKQFIKRAENRGYIFPDNLVPNRPKKITQQSVNRLRKLDADTLYRRAQWVDQETGELRRGEVGRERERSAAGKRAAATRKAKKLAEQRFWAGGFSGKLGSNEDIPYGEPTPEDFDRIRAEAFLEEFLERLNTPITTYINFNGRQYRRRADVARIAEAGRQRIVAIVTGRISELGKPIFGRMIHPFSEHLNTLLDTLMYDSDGGGVSSAITELIQIVIQSNSLLPEDKKLIGAYEEWEETWN